METERVVTNLNTGTSFREPIPPTELETVRSNRANMRQINAASDARQQQRATDLETLKTAGLPELREILARLIDA